MPLELGSLRDALIDAGATEELARKAAEEAAGYENRIASLETSLTLLKWMVGFNLAFTLAILWRVFA